MWSSAPVLAAASDIPAPESDMSPLRMVVSTRTTAIATTAAPP